jgi:hypothetical protein
MAKKFPLLLYKVERNSYSGFVWVELFGSFCFGFVVLGWSSPGRFVVS